MKPLLIRIWEEYDDKPDDFQVVVSLGELRELVKEINDIMSGEVVLLKRSEVQ